MLDNQSLSKNTTRNVLVILLGFAFFIRLTVGLGYMDTHDTFWYRDWAFALQNGLFDIYTKADQIKMDYPPIYLFFLFLTGQAYRIVGNGCHMYTQMFLMKFWPIFFDMICGYVLYRICSKYGRMTGLFAAAIWLFNPSVIFNTAFWGQTDQLMCLLLLLAFWLLEQDRPVLCCVVFALAGLTKFQCLYFTPVLLIELFMKTNLKTFFKGIGAAAVTVAAVFLPFMIGAGNPKLFFDVYLKGQGTYPHCTLNAFNFYGIFGLNWFPDNTPLFGGVTFYMLSIIITVMSVIALLCLYIYGRRVSSWVGGLFLMQSLFMLTTRMHERYQFVVLIFALMAYIVHKNQRFLNLFFTLSIMTLLNQAIPMFHWNQPNSPFGGMNYGIIMALLSIINLCIYLWSTYECIQFFMKEEGNQNSEVPLESIKE